MFYFYRSLKIENKVSSGFRFPLSGVSRLTLGVGMYLYAVHGLQTSFFLLLLRSFNERAT